MIFLKWLALAVGNLFVTLITIIVSPILPVFASQQLGPCDNNRYIGMGPRLPKWLSWFQTPDNSLDGDATFERENPPSYLNQAKWLRRNPGYNVGTRYLTAPYDTKINGNPAVKDNDNAKAGWCFVRSNGLFQLRICIHIPFTARCIWANFGWNIMGLADPAVNPKPNPWEATFAFSPRLSGFR